MRMYRRRAVQGVMERSAFRAVSQGLFPGFLSLVLMTPVSGLPPPAPLPPSPLRPPRTSEPARLPLPLPPPGRLRCPDSGTWGTAPALLAPRAAFATAGSGFWASAGGGRWPGRPEPEIWYPGRGRVPLGPEGRLCDRGIWFLGICRQEGAGPAGRSLKSGILVGVGAALLRGSGSRILVPDILRFWNPESGNRDLESGTGIWNLETGIWKPVTDFRSAWNPRGPG